MSIRENIDINYKNSIKDKKPEITNTLRLVKSAIKDKDIAARTNGNDKGISESEILGLLQNLIKQRRDSIESFKIADRNDLIEKEEAEILIINTFLPEQKNEQQTTEIIEEEIKNNNFNSIKDMVKLMGIIKGKYSGQVDMALVGKIAKTKLVS